MCTTISIARVNGSLRPKRVCPPKSILIGLDACDTAKKLTVYIAQAASDTCRAVSLFSTGAKSLKNN